MDFGFSINKSGILNMDENKQDLAKKLAELEPSFLACISCGCCAATCSAGQFTNFNLRKLQLMLKRGEIKSLKQETHKCMLCGKCSLSCPKGINTRNVLIHINKITS